MIKKADKKVEKKVDKKIEKKKTKPEQQELAGVPLKSQMSAYCEKYLDKKKDIKGCQDELKLIANNILREMNAHKQRRMRYQKKIFEAVDQQKLHVGPVR